MKLNVIAFAVVAALGAGYQTNVAAQSGSQTPTQDVGVYEQDNGMDLGWLGLIGLVGLMGMRRAAKRDSTLTSSARG